LLVRAQAQCVAGNVIIDVGKKIFIRCDAESGRSIFPLDPKRAAGVDVSKGADRAFIGLDMAVASNSNPPTSGGQHDTCGEKYDRDLLHRNVPLSMRREDERFWIQKSCCVCCSRGALTPAALNERGHSLD
jgi:hypothetical protein